MGDWRDPVEGVPTGDLQQFGLSRRALKPGFSDHLDVQGQVLEAA